MSKEYYAVYERRDPEIKDSKWKVHYEKLNIKELVDLLRYIDKKEDYRLVSVTEVRPCQE